MPIGEDSPLKAHALGDLEAVDGAAAWAIRKRPGFASRALCFIGTLDQATMAPLSKAHVSDFQRF